MTDENLINVIAVTIHKANDVQMDKIEKILKEQYKSKLDCKLDQSKLKAPLYEKIDKNSKMITKAAVLLVTTNIFTAAVVGTVVRFIFK